MKKKRLGNTELGTAPIVLGGNVFGWTLDEKESFKILDEFQDMGFNTIDTADVYSRWADGNKGGESESILGKWMKQKGNRDKINIITKVGSDMGQGQKDISEKHILQAVEDSLSRLQTDHIDLYLSHWDDEKTPVEETLGAYQKLIKEGKLRFIGASNFGEKRLRSSLEASEEKDLPRYEVFQPEYNLYDRSGFENGTAEICKKMGLGVITYYSLASGFLTGKYRSKDDFDKSVRGSKMDSYLDARGKKILSALDEISEKHQVSQAAVSLAWLINSPLVTAPIASATKSSHLEAFQEAVKLNLDKTEIEKLNRASGNS